MNIGKFVLPLLVVALLGLPSASATHLKEPSNIPLWTSFASNGIFLFIFGLLFLLSYNYAGKHEDTSNVWTPVRHCSFAVFICLFLMQMDLILLVNQQGTTVRDDGHTTNWGRLGTYIIVMALFASVVQNYLESIVDADGHTTESGWLSWSAVISVIVGTTMLLLATLSSNNNYVIPIIYAAFWYTLSIVLFGFSSVWSIKTQGFKNNTMAWLMLIFFTIILGILILFFGLGPDASGWVGHTTERSLYTVYEFMISLYILFAIFLEKKNMGLDLRTIFSNAKHYGTSRRSAAEKRKL